MTIKSRSFYIHEAPVFLKEVGRLNDQPPHFKICSAVPDMYVCVCVCVCDAKLVNTISQEWYWGYMPYEGILIAHGP